RYVMRTIPTNGRSASRVAAGTSASSIRLGNRWFFRYNPRPGTVSPGAEETTIMPRPVGTAFLAGLLFASPLAAQSPPRQDLPKPHVPVRSATRQELDHAEALKLYGLAVLHERNNRLVE